MSTSNSPSCSAPGPDDPYDINVDKDTLHKLAQWQLQYGDILCVKPLRRESPSIVLNHPDPVRHVLIGNHRNYAKGVGFERVAMLLGNGIIVSDGEFWRSQRRMMQPAFHKSVIARMSAMMHECNFRKLAQWSDKASRSVAVDVTHDMSELALEVILRALFSDDLDRLIDNCGENPFALLVDDVTRDLKLAMRFRALTKHVSEIVLARRKQNRIEPDFLSLMMEARDKLTGEPMTDKALIDEVMTIIVAGHETTAGTLNWAWYLLSQHPEVEQAMHAEVDSLTADPRYEDLESLSYTRQLIDETLRLYPPVWLFSRKAIADDTLVHGESQFSVTAGTNVFLCPYLLHRDERFWSEPDRFEPMRFQQTTGKARNYQAYFPFSLGSRRCIGEFFSMVDMQLHIGMLARHVSLRHVPGIPVDIEPLINLRSQNSIMMMPVLRHS
ncbi:MAG: cytochrome P450 [Granulosicoccus sp.]|nr:cytochrome P450 [Granulosicoccus sp.]